LTTTGITPAQTLVVLEATGTYWCRLTLDLRTTGYQVAAINPAQSHYFATAQLRRSKTAALDAQRLAEFAARMRPALGPPPPRIYHELEQRLQLRQELLTACQFARNQLHGIGLWTALWLLVATGNFTSCASVEEAVGYAG
jgi:transposase